MKAKASRIVIFGGLAGALVPLLTLGLLWLVPEDSIAEGLVGVVWWVVMLPFVLFPSRHGAFALNLAAIEVLWISLGIFGAFLFWKLCEGRRRVQ